MLPLRFRCRRHFLHIFCYFDFREIYTMSRLITPRDYFASADILSRRHTRHDAS